MYNRVILMGRLTANPELRQTTSGISVCRFNIAVDRSFAKQGEEKQADFFNIVCWRQHAEFVSRYFSKGRMIHVEGRLQNNNYTDQNGIKRYSVDVQADNICFCGDKAKSQSQDENKNHATAQQKQNQIELGELSDFEEVLSDGEVPF